MAIGTAAAVLGGASILGGVASSVIGGRSAKSAASTQAAASDAAIAEQRRQFNETAALLKPFVDAGDDAVLEMQRILGLRGDPAQAGAIQNIQDSPQYNRLVTEGENAIRQNAAATGGLRGGNVQAALAQFRPGILADLIDQQYGRLSGLAGMGQASAAGQAAAGQQTASNVGTLLENRGAAMAGGQLAQGQMYQNILGTLGQGAGFFGRMAGVF